MPFWVTPATGPAGGPVGGMPPWGTKKVLGPHSLRPWYTGWCKKFLKKGSYAGSKGRTTVNSNLEHRGAMVFVDMLQWSGV